MTDPTTGVPTREAVRLALIELLTTSAHHDAATPATLTAIADTRRDLATLHSRTNPAGRHAPERDRHAALSGALGDISKALLATYPYRHTDPWRLRAGLTVLAAVALAWLDTLPHPHNNDPNSGDNPEDDFSDGGPF
ncbi:MAG: hypothetical protein WBF75_12865 [Pseudonocardiaceae bacterium]